MRVVIQQRHSMRREVAMFGLVAVSGIVTVAALLVPQLIG
jgi:hypothetical protein